MIAGNPGLGKSFTTIDIAARVSRGLPFPDDSQSDEPGPGSVLFVTCEDDVADTIRPRLDSAGADASKVHHVHLVADRSGERLVNLATDIALISDAVRNLGDCRLIVVDPISAFLGETDSHKNAEVRGVLAPLAALAEEHRVAVVCVSHLNKNSQASAIYRMMGSLAFVAAARAAWAVVQDRADPERRLFLNIKNNVGRDAGGLAFKVHEPAAGGGPCVTWLGAVSGTADDALLTRPQSGQTQVRAVADWLVELLKDGPRAARDIEDDAEANGISEATLRRAKKEVKIQAERVGGCWVWSLPKAPSVGGDN
jgi:hypothetical protein